MKKSHIKALKGMSFTAILESDEFESEQLLLEVDGGWWSILNEQDEMVASGKVSKKGMEEFLGVLQLENVYMSGGAIH